MKHNKAYCGKLKEFIADESKTSKLYSKMGFKKEAEQEHEHMSFFKKKLRQCGCK